MSHAFEDLPLVEVEWIDSATRDGWGSIAEHTDPAPLVCRTAGYLLVQDDKKVVIAHSQHEDGDVCGSMTIPRVAVRRFTRLKGDG